MTNKLNLALFFNGNDYVEAKELFMDKIGQDSISSGPIQDNLMDEANIASLIIDLCKVGIPSICALIGLWLGKGKEITLLYKKKKITLKNVSESGAKAIIEIFLDEKN